MKPLRKVYVQSSSGNGQYAFQTFSCWACGDRVNFDARKYKIRQEGTQFFILTKNKEKFIVKEKE